ncbi:hypothetical protein LCGC14_0481900, partial [marine sediment metagenome]
VGGTLLLSSERANMNIPDNLMERMVQMYRMSVWDHCGRMYMPIYDYDGQICAYARAEEALEIWCDDLALRTALEH